MKIVVLVKEVPDTYEDRKLNLETGLADRASSESILDEIGERSIEAALSYADANPDTEVVLLSVGPESAAATVRKGLAMGASSAVHVADDGLLGADLGLTAQVLAAALRRIGFDLIVSGNQSTDGNGGVIASMVAELLEVPAVTSMIDVEITESAVRGSRSTGDATMRAEVALPAVISVTESMPDGRFPNFKGIMAAKKKPFETLTLADLDIDAEDHTSSRSIMIAVAERPAREAGTKITDDGDAARQLADFLIENRLV